MGRRPLFGWLVVLALGALPARAEVPLTRPAPVPAPPIASAAASPADIPTISTGELRARLLKGEPLYLVDVRSAEAFEREHLAGAHSVPYVQLDARQAGLPRNRTLVLYCA